MAKKIRVNFKGVDKEIRKGGGGSVRVPEGDYLVKVVEGEVKDNKAEDGQYIRWKFQIAKGEYKGKVVYGNTSLKSDALWSLRNLIHAATGKNVAGKALDLDLEKLYGKLVGAEITDNEYKKGDSTKISSQVNVCFPKEELEEAEEEEDDDDDTEGEEEEEEETEEEDLEDVDVDEL